jgi:hypothetical protein
METKTNDRNAVNGGFQAFLEGLQAGGVLAAVCKTEAARTRLIKQMQAAAFFVETNLNDVDGCKRYISDASKRVSQPNTLEKGLLIKFAVASYLDGIRYHDTPAALAEALQELKLIRAKLCIVGTMYGRPSGKPDDVQGAPAQVLSDWLVSESWHIVECLLGYGGFDPHTAPAVRGFLEATTTGRAVAEVNCRVSKCVASL